MIARGSGRMRQRTVSAIRVAALIGAWLTSAPAWAELTQEPAVLHEREFAKDPALVARPHDVVVLEVERMRRGRASRNSVVRYSLDAGTYTFCLDADDTGGAGMVVEDSAGHPVLQLTPSGGCTRTTVPSGTYVLRFIHDGRLITGASRAAFAQAAPPSPSLLDAQGKPIGGWWALRPDPRLDPARREGRVVLESQSALATGSRPLTADFTSKQIDDTALFDVHDPSRPLVKASGGLPLDLTKLGSSSYYTLGADDPARTQTFFHDTTPLVVTDLGQYRAQLGVRRADHNLANVFLGKTSPAPFMLNYDQPPPDPPPASVEVLFRFFPDGTQIGELQEGEIAIFQECNYGGKAAVFAGRIPNLEELSSSVTTLAKSAASVKLGFNTGVILHTGPVYTGTRHIAEVDTPCLDATPVGRNTTSLEVRLLAPTLLLSTRACVGCKLTGLDLSGYDLSGVDLEGADLSQANLSVTNLSSADLSKANLKGVNLGSAVLKGAKLNAANLDGANLGGAFLTNQPPGIPEAASLVGAHLKNVNLTSADLSGADLTGASFYGTLPAGQKTCAVAGGFTQNCASAHSATMNNTQFANAYLYGVDFTGATIQGVQFGGAVLIGTNFDQATLSTDPRVGTNSGFASAFLQGANLATATLVGTSLEDAFVDFRDGGNDMYLQLDGSHTVFAGWKTPGQKVCVFVFYGSPTTVPTTNTTLTCPDGSSAAPNGCGSTEVGNTKWKSPVAIATANTPASYVSDATYTPHAAAPICSPPSADW